MSFFHESSSELVSYGGLLVFLLLGCVISLLFLFLSHVRGVQRPDPQKNSAYECGFAPEGSLKKPFSIPFYLVAILFVAFDIEVALLFPWALALFDAGWAGFASASVFLLILGIGFLYEWRAGALEWE